MSGISAGSGHHKNNTKPINKPTLTSILRESIAVENKRVERVSSNNDNGHKTQRRHSAVGMKSHEKVKSNTGRHLSDSRYLIAKMKDETYLINKATIDEAMRASIIDERERQERQSDSCISSRDNGHSLHKPQSGLEERTLDSLDSQMFLRKSKSVFSKSQEEFEEHDTIQIKSSTNTKESEPNARKTKQNFKEKEGIHEKESTTIEESEQNAPETNFKDNDGMQEKKSATAKESQPNGPKARENFTDKDGMQVKESTTTKKDEPLPYKMQQNVKEKDIIHENTPVNTKITRQKLPKQSKNLEFYQNKIKSDLVNGHKIEDMLKWKGNYTELERNHRYIQWLFPISEGSGMNPNAQSLQAHEAEAITRDNDLKLRVLKSYEMMLDFYGMVPSETGEIRRSRKWQQRFQHLNKSTHNYLRITRILKSLGELGFQHFQLPWLTFILHEAIEHNTLPRLHGNSVWHWINAITRDEDRAKVIQTYEKLMGSPLEAAEKEINDNDLSEDSEAENDSPDETENKNSGDNSESGKNVKADITKTSADIKTKSQHFENNPEKLHRESDGVNNQAQCVKPGLDF